MCICMCMYLSIHVHGLHVFPRNSTHHLFSFCHCQFNFLKNHRRWNLTAVSFLCCSLVWQVKQTYGLVFKAALLFFCIVAVMRVPHWHVMSLHRWHKKVRTSSRVDGNNFEVSASIVALHFLLLHEALRHTTHVLHSGAAHGGLQHWRHRVRRSAMLRFLHMECVYFFASPASPQRLQA